MTNQVMDLFGQMDVVAIESFIKDEVKPYLKERKETEKNDLMTSVKSQLSDGDTVTVRYKDSEITGTVVSLREKTFSILTDEILNAKGEPSRISRGYNFVSAIGENIDNEEVI